MSEIKEDQSMGTNMIVKETEVLVATTKFLIGRGIFPYQFSITQQGKEETLNRILSLYDSIDIKPTFTNRGPDIIGISEKEWWQVECKGFGSGQSQTHRNNIDRSLASVVSYYEDKFPGFEDKFKDAQPFLGLALPTSQAYINLLTKRVRKPLRKKLNLWVLLFDKDSDSVKPITPEETISQKW